MKRLHAIPTIIVGLAVAAMIALGMWQLQRRAEKAALVARYAANLSLPPMAYPELAPVAPAALFRTSQITCLRVVGWRSEAGRSSTGQSGYRHIAECATGADGPGALVDMGVSADPKKIPAWIGGRVEGIITIEPDHSSLIGRLFSRRVPLRPMLVAETAASGLSPSARPDPGEVPNNHLAYAVQWFVFAAAAAVIYALALRRRREK